nr:NADH dehydrogenase subunit 5 [Glomeridesmus spelaeus]
MNICLISSLMFFLLSFITYLLFMFMMINNELYLFELNLGNLNSFLFEGVFIFDWISLLFVSFVLMISSIVLYYSNYYMMGDMNIYRFCIMVIMFVMSMVLVIISPNLITILLGWDGLGLISYCLVVYYMNMRSYSGGMLTAMSNRIGDVFILGSIALMFNIGSESYYYYYNFDMSFYLSLFLIIAAFTKSAQIPFSAWLPAAMAAPTPVSSLVHSSTLVTAGVYLLIRFFSFFTFFDYMWVFMFFSLLTLLMAGVCANFEFDLKKIVALSTLSQLGFMMMILFFGNLKMAFFHLLIHAIFKALLFICAGNLIHVSGGWQDIRGMSGIGMMTPMSLLSLMVSSLCLCGFPFLCGFYSKDLILESIMSSSLNLWFVVFTLIGIGLTCSYSVRLIYYLVFMKKSGSVISMEMDVGFGMENSILMMSFMSVIFGYYINYYIFPYPGEYYITLELKMIGLGLLLFGMLIGWFISKVWYSLSSKLSGYIYFMSLMWFMDYLSTQMMINKLVSYINEVTYEGDYAWGEYIGGQGMKKMMLMLSGNLNTIHSVSLKIFLVIFLFFMIVMFLI